MERGDTSQSGTSVDEAPTENVAPEDRSDGERPTVAPPQRGDAIGRYVLLDTVGVGGMGTVHRAYDPKLRREVALKRLRPDSLDDESEARLVREAQAMAQLSHPNVVAVYDVEVDAEGVTLAMEYVPGKTLRTWLHEETHRPTSAIVAVFRAAGEGLAAAHRAGLVHRDFKPGNVLIAQGRDQVDAAAVKVTDFGLAKALGESVVDVPRAKSGDASRSGDWDTPLTRADIVLGTPRYMSPEQHRGRPADHRADQYSFCVALWEAIVGEPPFSGELSAMGEAKADGPPPWPRDAAASAEIVEAIRRGLSPDPDDRFESMDPLLAVLAHDPVRRRRRWIAAVGALGVAGIALVGVRAWTARRAALCSGASQELAQSWSGETRAAVLAGVGGVDGTFAETTAAWAVAELDAYAVAWASTHRDVCEATRLRGEQSQEAMALRMACLERARIALRAAVVELEREDVAVAARVVDVVGTLPTLSRCEDLEALHTEAAAPADDEVTHALAKVATVRAVVAAGRLAEAAVLVSDHGDTANEDPGLVARWSLARGAMLAAKDDLEGAEVALEAAMRGGLEGSAPVVAAEATTALVEVVGIARGRHEEGLWLADVALGEAEGHRAGPRLQARAQEARGRVLAALGRHAEADAAIRTAIDLWQRDQVAAHPVVGLALARLADAKWRAKRWDEAATTVAQAHATIDGALGEGHPCAWFAWQVTGRIALSRGQLDEAAHAFDRADSGQAQFEASASDRAALAFDRARLELARGRAQDAVRLATRTQLRLAAIGDARADEIAAWLEARRDEDAGGERSMLGGRSESP